MRVEAFADGSPSDYDGQYVERFDPDYGDGLGRVWTTTDKEKALKFADAGEALEYWRQPSSVRPKRDDGQPNRPMTALTVSVLEA